MRERGGEGDECARKIMCMCVRVLIAGFATEIVGYFGPFVMAGKELSSRGEGGETVEERESMSIEEGECVLVRKWRKRIERKEGRKEGKEIEKKQD